MIDLGGENDLSGVLVDYRLASDLRSRIDLLAQIRQRGIIDFFLENERKRKSPQHGGLSSSEEYFRHSRSCRRERFGVPGEFLRNVTLRPGDFRTWRNTGSILM